MLNFSCAFYLCFC